MHDREDRRMAGLGLLLFAGTVMILLACFLAGPWDLTGSERRTSLQFSGIVSMALLVPLPSPFWSLFDLRTRVRRWGRIVGAGLVVAS